MFSGARPSRSAFRAELCERLRLTRADLERPIRDNSRGTKQKLGLVGALQHEPDLLVLDEPTTGLDPLVREEVFALLRDGGAPGSEAGDAAPPADAALDHLRALGYID